jgi:hypothetical protein
VFKYALKSLNKGTLMMWSDVKLDNLKQNLYARMSISLQDYKIMCSDLPFQNVFPVGKPNWLKFYKNVTVHSVAVIDTYVMDVSSRN